MNILKSLFYNSLLILIPNFVFAQQDSSARSEIIEGKVVNGTIIDKDTQEPLSGVSVFFTGTQTGTKTDNDGKFSLGKKGKHSALTISYVGYTPLKHDLNSGKSAEIIVLMENNNNQLQEVSISSGKKSKYRNKGNPAVELIQKVIDHKRTNRLQNSEYLQYDQYERIQFSLTEMSDKFLHKKTFDKYRFLLDTSSLVNNEKQTTLPMYMSEKIYERYFRKSPEKEIKILKAHKEVDFSAYIDSAGLDMYLNRLYENFDIYQNDIFFLKNEFLSPIADHSPAFYKYFITDTLTEKKLIEISFMPRNAGDRLFEGKLYVTMDGKYAVNSFDLGINKGINLNFIRSARVHQEFRSADDGKLYLYKSYTQSNFGINEKKGMSILGERTVNYSNYKSGVVMPEVFYRGADDQIYAGTHQKDIGFWAKKRGDTLSLSKSKIYANIDSLKKMPSFKRSMWITSTVVGGYGDLGPVQIGPIESIISSNRVEGLRLRIGGRTTPLFNKSIYLEGYAAYGFKDEQLKYYMSGMYSFNKSAPYKFPNNFVRASYQYDTDIPGKNFLIEKNQNPLASISRGPRNLWLYNRIAKLEYTRELENHFTYNFGIRNLVQRPAALLTFQTVANPDNPISKLSTTELTFMFRFAPHEKIFQGPVNRRIIKSKHPIFTLSGNYGMKGIMNNPYNYLNINTSIAKRFYLSQAGFTDVTLNGGTVLGRVPFPLLAILPANQTYLYEKESYNMMNFMEFVSDKYVGINMTHSFNGFLLNKVPLLQDLKLREYLSFKIIYGGLRNENNPATNPDTYKFPVHSSGRATTYALSNTPYIEAGFGIGNIFKVLRVTAIKRFTYLDHPGVGSIGLRFSFNPDL